MLVDFIQIVEGYIFSCLLTSSFKFRLCADVGADDLLPLRCLYLNFFDTGSGYVSLSCAEMLYPSL